MTGLDYLHDELVDDVDEHQVPLVCEDCEHEWDGGLDRGGLYEPPSITRPDCPRCGGPGKERHG